MLFLSRRQIQLKSAVDLSRNQCDILRSSAIVSIHDYGLYDSYLIVMFLVGTWGPFSGPRGDCSACYALDVTYLVYINT